MPVATLWDELLELDRRRVWHPYGPMPAADAAAAGRLRARACG